MVQFDTIKFHKTFRNQFGQFVWIEKKATGIVAFHFIKRPLKRWKESDISKQLNESSIFLYDVMGNVLFDNPC